MVHIHPPSLAGTPADSPPPRGLPCPTPTADWGPLADLSFSLDGTVTDRDPPRWLGPPAERSVPQKRRENKGVQTSLQPSFPPAVGPGTSGRGRLQKPVWLGSDASVRGAQLLQVAGQEGCPI